MLDQLPDGRYVILGERSAHAELAALLRHYAAAPVAPYREFLTVPCPRVRIPPRPAVISPFNIPFVSPCRPQRRSRFSRAAEDASQLGKTKAGAGGPVPPPRVCALPCAHPSPLAAAGQAPRGGAAPRHQLPIASDPAGVQHRGQEAAGSRAGGGGRHRGKLRGGKGKAGGGTGALPEQLQGAGMWLG